MVTKSTSEFLPFLAKSLQYKHITVRKQHDAFSLERFLCKPWGSNRRSNGNSNRKSAFHDHSLLMFWLFLTASVNTVRLCVIVLKTLPVHCVTHFISKQLVLVLHLLRQGNNYFFATAASLDFQRFWWLQKTSQMYRFRTVDWKPSDTYSFL